MICEADDRLVDGRLADGVDAGWLRVALEAGFISRRLRHDPLSRISHLAAYRMSVISAVIAYSHVKAKRRAS